MTHVLTAYGRMILLLALLVPAVVAAQDRGNPESRFVRQFVPWGEMQGPALQCDTGAQDFGQYIWPVGDVNHDGIADWIVSRIRCDTVVYELNWRLYVQELFLYKGVRSGLPLPDSGERISMGAEAGEATLLASGDWDGDHNRDLAVSFEIFNDTSDGNFIGGYHLHSLIIFWGNSKGNYSISDTTRLPCDRDKCLGFGQALSYDVDNDGVEDLIAWGGGHHENGTLKPTANIFVFRGHLNGRWGQGNIGYTADMQWWKVPPFNFLQMVDQNCDGYRDIALMNQTYSGTGNVAVAYGQPGMLFDTVNIDTVNLLYSNGHYALFADITGDGVPELAVNCGSQEKIKIFAGKPGQQLREQYGTGDEPENGKPWAEVWLPNKIHDGWSSAGFGPLYNLGGLGRGGVSDLWTYSWPFIIGYIGGKALDSSIDAEFDTRGYGDFSSIVRLGDIDGSGLSSFAMTFTGNPGRVLFFKPLDSLPVNGNVRRTLPHPVGFRCEHAAEVEGSSMPGAERPRLSAAGR